MKSRFEILKDYGQEHLLSFYDELTEHQRSQLIADIDGVDWENLINIYEKQGRTHIGGKSIAASKIDESLLEELPPGCIGGTVHCDSATLNEYLKIGITSIKQGKVAALLLAGGQGTRLGVDYPKGMYDVGPPICKSLFELQANRIVQLIRLVESKTGEKSAPIIWYIMTSEATMATTRKFFDENNYFGLNKNDVILFEQNTLPCFDLDGKVLLEVKYKLSKAPDGNGGIYAALNEKGILNHMSGKGVEFVHIYCVDNILVRVCDPIFIGYCISRKADVAVKVVEKEVPNESLGILCRYDNKFKVIEYSEISEEIAQRRDNLTDKLIFRAGSICDHLFKIEFLSSVKDRKLLYHVAKKKIPYINLGSKELVKPEEPNGLKFEKFIFDVFEFTEKLVAWEVKREDEFSPLKNSLSSPKDNPSTALKALIRAYNLGILSL